MFYSCIQSMKKLNAMKKSSIITAIAAFNLFFNMHVQAEGLQNRDEQYINDIPFNTHLIAEAFLSGLAMEQTFVMEEDEFINDIPFNTAKIARQELSRRAMEQVFACAGEEQIDDIPFNTSIIASCALTCNGMFSHQQNELVQNIQ